PSLFALLALCCWTLAAAQSYPAKPVTLIVPFPPGGSTDIIGRIAAEGLQRELGQPFVVDNRGGAGGAIGAKAIADAAPDGYTLGIATISTHVVNPIVRADLRYDPLNDALAGQVQVLFDNLPSSLPHIHAGKLRALAVAAEKRVASLPDVPTFAETGQPLVNDPSWFGLIGPAKLPADITARLHGALV